VIRLLAFAGLFAACAEPPRVVLSRGTTPPAFLRRASLAQVVAHYERTAESGTFEGAAVLMDYAYLRAHARHQGRARFDDRAAIEAELAKNHARYGGEHTSFSVRVTLVSDLQLQAQDPMLDLRAWSFRLRDARRRTVRSDSVETVSPQGRSEIESHPTWGGAIATARHTYSLSGVVRFPYRLSADATWITLYAVPPSSDEEPLRFLWLLR
jgi:hypothetical protein